MRQVSRKTKFSRGPFSTCSNPFRLGQIPGSKPHSSLVKKTKEWRWLSPLPRAQISRGLISKSARTAQLYHAVGSPRRIDRTSRVRPASSPPTIRAHADASCVGSDRERPASGRSHRTSPPD